MRCQGVHYPHWAVGKRDFQAFLSVLFGQDRVLGMPLPDDGDTSFLHLQVGCRYVVRAALLDRIAHRDRGAMGSVDRRGGVRGQTGGLPPLVTCYIKRVGEILFARIFLQNTSPHRSTSQQR